MSYRVRWELSALRELRKLDARTALRVLHDVTDLTGDPRPAASLQLVGGDGERRLRVGDYRVIYIVDDAVGEVAITEVGHRRDIYDS